jgi:hypothetical protein
MVGKFRATNRNERFLLKVRIEAESPTLTPFPAIVLILMPAIGRFCKIENLAFDAA